MVPSNSPAVHTIFIASKHTPRLHVQCSGDRWSEWHTDFIMPDLHMINQYGCIPSVLFQGLPSCRVKSV